MKFITAKPFFSFPSFVVNDLADLGSLSYYNARDCFYEIIKDLGLESGDVILFPCSICGVALVPFLQSNIKPLFYSLDDNLNPDIDHIADLLKSYKIKALVNVHFYGLASNEMELLEICKNEKIAFIEDCALILPRRRDSYIGNLGNYSVFSVRKFFGVNDGAILRGINNGVTCRRSSLGVELMSLLFILKQLLRLIKYMLKGFSVKIDLHGNQEEIDLSYVRNGNISKVSKYILSRAKSDTLTKRLENLKTYREAFKNTKVKVVGDSFCENKIPYIFPIRVSNRNELFRILLSEGIYPEPSLNAPYKDYMTAEEFERFKNIDLLASEFMGLPLHQDITRDDILKIAELVKRNV